jgi:hypothetical protein
MPFSTSFMQLSLDFGSSLMDEMMKMLDSGEPAHDGGLGGLDAALMSQIVQQPSDVTFDSYFASSAKSDTPQVADSPKLVTGECEDESGTETGSDNDNSETEEETGSAASVEHEVASSDRRQMSISPSPAVSR